MTDGNVWLEARLERDPLWAAIYQIHSSVNNNMLLQNSDWCIFDTDKIGKPSRPTHKMPKSKTVSNVRRLKYELGNPNCLGKSCGYITLTQKCSKEQHRRQHPLHHC